MACCSPFWISFIRVSGHSMSWMMAELICSDDESVTARQAWPATSAMALTGVVMIGQPLAMDSARGRPNPSRLLGQMSAIAF